MTPENPPFHPKPPVSALAIVGLVLTLLCFTWPIGLVVSIVALVRISDSEGRLGGKTLAIISLCLCGLLVLSSSMAAITIPNFIRFQARSKQGECKANLKALYAAQKALMQKSHGYADKLGPLDFSPERGNRYTYVIAPSGTLRVRDSDSGQTAASPDAVGVTVDTFKYVKARSFLWRDLPQTFAGGVHLGIAGTCPDHCSVTMACLGNIDNDPELDLWSISTEDRTAPDGERIPAGVPYNEVNDVLK